MTKAVYSLPSRVMPVSTVSLKDSKEKAELSELQWQNRSHISCLSESLILHTDPYFLLSDACYEHQYLPTLTESLHSITTTVRLRFHLRGERNRRGTGNSINIFLGILFISYMETKVEPQINFRTECKFIIGFEVESDRGARLGSLVASFAAVPPSLSILLSLSHPHREIMESQLAPPTPWPLCSP